MRGKIRIDLYSGGMEMAGRSVGADYKYNHNGQNKDDEVFKGFLSADYWGYDARLIRRWEQDPLAYEFQSPYVCFNNNPIVFSDPLGLEGEPGNGGPKKGDFYVCGNGGGVEVFDGEKYVPYKDCSSGNGVKGMPLTIGGNFGQNKFADGAISIKIMQGYSPSQKQAVRMAGMMNAMTSNEAFGFGRREAQDEYMDPELQSLYLQGQIAGDIASILSGQAQIAIGGGMVGFGESLALSGAGVASTGAGAPIGAGMAIVGEGVAILGSATVIHGQIVTGIATANLAKTTALLAATTYHNGNPNAAQSDGGGSGDGARPNGDYENADYHGVDGNSIKSAAPSDGQKALNESIIVKQKPNGLSTRIAIENEKFVVLMEHIKGKFHGHTRPWSALDQSMKNALIRAGKTGINGKIK